MRIECWKCNWSAPVAEGGDIIHVCGTTVGGGPQSDVNISLQVFVQAAWRID
jgi:hypothetical protein